ncbi:hypothetical protein V8C44DRAFT_73247 [Trichoderma aethiopicum]
MLSSSRHLRHQGHQIEFMAPLQYQSKPVTTIHCDRYGHRLGEAISLSALKQRDCSYRTKVLEWVTLSHSILDHYTSSSLLPTYTLIIGIFTINHEVVLSCSSKRHLPNSHTIWGTRGISVRLSLNGRQIHGGFFALPHVRDIQSEPARVRPQFELSFPGFLGIELSRLSWGPVSWGSASPAFLGVQLPRLFLEFQLPQLSDSSASPASSSQIVAHETPRVTHEVPGPQGSFSSEPHHPRGRA